MQCCKCNEELVTTKGAAYQIIGYEMAREKGGTNHVMQKERTGKVMCSTCAIRMKYGISDDQLTLA